MADTGIFVLNVGAMADGFAPIVMRHMCLQTIIKIPTSDIETMDDITANIILSLKPGTIIVHGTFILKDITATLADHDHPGVLHPHHNYSLQNQIAE